MLPSHHKITDAERLAELHNTGLMDGPPETVYDQLASVAARLAGAPVALVSLVGEDCQFFKGVAGGAATLPAERRTPLSHSFCKHVVCSGKPFVVNDAHQHPLVKDNPAIQALGVTAYLGVPLTVPSGHTLGALCVIDSRPREWRDNQVEALAMLAEVVLSTIERGDCRAEGLPRTESRTAERADAGDAPLERAVADYLSLIDRYDECLLDSRSDPSVAATERDLHSALGEAAERARQAARTSAEAMQGKEPSPFVRDLRRALETYFDAVTHRSHLSVQFQQGGAALDAVERAVADVTEAEQALRLALHKYKALKH